MPDPRLNLLHRRKHERGNIVLIAALMVMAFGGVGLGMARLVQGQMGKSTEVQLSNYGGTLAVNVAESAINQVLFNWNTNVAAPALGAQTPFPDLETVYTRYSPAKVTTRCTYAVVVDSPDAGHYRLTATATVTTDTGLRPKKDWQIITRRVVAVVNNTAPYATTGYAR